MPRTNRNGESVDSSCYAVTRMGGLLRLGLARVAKGFGLAIMLFDIREGSILGELPCREIRLPSVTFPPAGVHSHTGGVTCARDSSCQGPHSRYERPGHHALRGASGAQLSPWRHALSPLFSQPRASGEQHRPWPQPRELCRHPLTPSFPSPSFLGVP